jgi:hypothetical protein
MIDRTAIEDQDGACKRDCGQRFEAVRKGVYREIIPTGSEKELFSLIW